MFRKVCVMLLICLILGPMIGYAEEHIIEFTEPDTLTLNDFTIDEKLILSNPNGENIGEKNIDIKEIIYQTKVFHESNMKEVNEINDAGIMSEKYEPDKYEPNDTFETAFPFENTDKMIGNPYIEGYISANIHDENDNDFFSIYLQADKEYFFHLKNLRYDYDMYLVHLESESAWGNPQYGTTEEYFYFIPPKSGRYYIVILGNGFPDYMNYFLYAGEAILTKNLEEDTGLTFNFRGSGRSSYQMYDTRNKIIPDDGVLNKVYITSTGNGYWTGLKKYLRASDGSVYYNRGGLDLIDYPYRTQYASQIWYIAGEVVNTDFFAWTPHIKMEYSYVIRP